MASTLTPTAASFLRYLIWIGSDQEKTFGPTISGLIHKHIEPERMCLWDSKARGAFPAHLPFLSFHQFRSPWRIFPQVVDQT